MQDPPHPLAVLGVIAIARNRDQAVDEPVESVTTDEQAHALALAEPEHAHREVEQLVGLDLKQRVARIGLEDLGQRRRLVAVRRESGTAEARSRTLSFVSIGISRALSLYAAAACRDRGTDARRRPAPSPPNRLTPM